MTAPVLRIEPAPAHASVPVGCAPPRRGASSDVTLTRRAAGCPVLLSGRGRPIEGVDALHARQSLEPQLHRPAVCPPSQVLGVLPGGGGHEYLVTPSAPGDP